MTFLQRPTWWMGAMLVIVAASLPLQLAAALRIFTPFAAVGAPIPVAVTSPEGATIVAVMFCLAALFAFASVRFAGTLADDARSARTVIAVQMLVSAVLLASPLLLTTNPYEYILYGRMWGILGINPYHPQLVAAHGDPVTQTCLSLAANPPSPDPYGPLWTLLVGVIARIEAHASLYGGLLTQRVLAIVGAVATTFGLLRLSRAWSASGHVRRVALVATHPLLLYESAVGGHNDALMIAPAVWAFALADEWPIIAAILLAMAACVKIVALAVAPFFVVKIIRRNWRTAIPALAIASLVGAALFAPFVVGQPHVNALPSLRSSIGFSAIGFVYLTSWRLFPLGSAALTHLLVTAFLIAGGAAVLAGLTVYVIRPMRAAIWTACAGALWSLPAVFTWYIPWLFPAIADTSRWSAYVWWLGVFAFLQYAFVTPYHPSTSALILIAAVVLFAPIALARRAFFADT